MAPLSDSCCVYIYTMSCGRAVMTLLFFPSKFWRCFFLCFRCSCHCRHRCLVVSASSSTPAPLNCTVSARTRTGYEPGLVHWSQEQRRNLKQAVLEGLWQSLPCAFQLMHTYPPPLLQHAVDKFMKAKPIIFCVHTATVL